MDVFHDYYFKSVVMYVKIRVTVKKRVAGNSDSPFKMAESYRL